MTALFGLQRQSLGAMILSVFGISAFCALLTLPLTYTFLTIAGPEFRALDGPSMGHLFYLGLSFQGGVLPVFLILSVIGLWGLFVRQSTERQLNWPFWLILCWGLALVASFWTAHRIESTASPMRLADMDFAPLHIRVALQAFLLFAKNSLMLLLVGFVFVTSMERSLGKFTAE